MWGCVLDSFSSGENPVASPCENANNVQVAYESRISRLDKPL